MTYEQIKPYIAKKLITANVHPEDPDVMIFNYTHLCQFEQAWDEVTMNCRGLIMNVKTGEVIARPFPKFFNYSEYEQRGWEFPKGSPIITEKMDGMLGILYALNGKSWVATRGSFTSDYAIWATKWWREKHGSAPYDEMYEKTNLFEIIYPESRIVVDYDFSALIHLTCLDTKTGLPCETTLPVEKVKTIPSTDVKELLKMDGNSAEGFVLYYSESNKRIKIKFPEYIRLHRIITNVSEISIWETLRIGKTINDIVENVPDEFHSWVKSVVDRLMGEFVGILDPCLDMAEEVEFLDRKTQVEMVTEKMPENKGIVLCLIDHKFDQARHLIWKKVRPFGKKVYKVDPDA